MRKFNPDINAVIRQFGAANGNFVESLARALPIMSVILTLIITVGTVISGNGDPKNIDPGTAQLRTDIELAINYQRSQQGLQPAEFHMELRNSAQAKAESNAAAGSLTQTTLAEDRILLLQARHESAGATADAFINMWAGDTANYNALMHEDNETMGVGVAEAGGMTYAVVQFTQQ